MSFPYRPAHRGLGRHQTRTPFASPKAEDVWARMIAAARACAAGEVQGPGVWEALKAARAEACGAAFPIQGEAPKAASNALLELTRTWALAGEAQRGWHGESVLAVARQCEVLLDQHQAAFARRIRGERDDD